MADDTQIRSQLHSAFRYVVEIEGRAEAAFTECTLPVIDWELEEVKEGGLNTYIHQLPGRRKANKVTLKNGVGKSTMVTWFIQTMSEQFVRKPITIKLLDPDFKTIMSWNLDGALPVKWTGPQLKADTSAVAIQTLDLTCNEVSIKIG